MQRSWIIWAGVHGFVAVALGAIGAHLLESRVGPEAFAHFETGLRYHMVHALALLGLAGLDPRRNARATRVAGCAFLAGILLFSGSLYAHALGGPGFLVHVTPFGGLAFLVGWAALVWRGCTQR